MSKIEYLSYDPEDGWEEEPTAADARDTAEGALDRYRDDSSEGWHEDVEHTAAFVAVPILRVEQVGLVCRDDYTPEQWEDMGHSDEHEWLCNYETRHVNQGLLAIIGAKSTLDVTGTDDLRAEMQKIIRASMVYGGELMDSEWAKIGALCAAAIDRINSKGG